jgi:hypothetical protein
MDLLDGIQENPTTVDVSDNEYPLDVIPAPAGDHFLLKLSLYLVILFLPLLIISTINFVIVFKVWKRNSNLQRGFEELGFRETQLNKMTYLSNKHVLTKMITQI